MHLYAGRAAYKKHENNIVGSPKNMHDSERRILLTYAQTVRDVDCAAATNDTCLLKELSKASRYLRQVVHDVIQRHGGAPLRIAAHGEILEARLKQKRCVKLPTAETLLDAFKMLNEDELNAKVAQLRANGDDGLHAVAGHLQDKIVDQCSHVTEEAVVSTSVGDDAVDHPLTNSEVNAVRDLHKVLMRLVDLKKKRKRATEELSSQCKKLREQVCDMLDRTGDLTINDSHGNTFVFRLKRRTVRVPLKKNEIAQHFAEAVNRMPVEAQSLEGLQRPATMTRMIEEYTTRVHGNQEVKVDFELIMY